eukprot:CAMPEP_0182585028 /NCGR_PEP_ID=MMETSP1324-20130603/59300_1 /TAXON_ID=236786 /ORGANISM="Florenciella sp., Strain RCC1587" /LENGTH=78 /DNA_ID=CAMNT_0024801797 /DNA_START=12 /DNA_END=244 /DNA_ORIENTATION=+
MSTLRYRDLRGGRLHGYLSGMHCAAKEERGEEDAVLRNRVLRPGLQHCPEHASVACAVCVVLEIFDGDRRAEEEEGLG